MSDLEIVDINATNIYEFPYCGIKDINKVGYKRKTDWLKKRFPEGLRSKVLYSATDKTVGYIEYIPGEYTWRAVDAHGYMVIHCIFLIPNTYKRKGYGSLLVEESVKDARKEKMSGVAVVTSRGTWMAGKELFLKNGFEAVDKAPPHFELLVRKFKKSDPSPKFESDWKKRLNRYGSGLTIIRSDQCPYIAKSVNEITETAEKRYGIKAKVVELKDCTEAQIGPSAYSIFAIVYDGKLIADHPVSNKRFMNIMAKEVRLR
ncbi:MAG: GNAT family N-acetyltransferase [Candidatus Aminicenantaceae bacterium]